MVNTGSAALVKRTVIVVDTTERVMAEKTILRQVIIVRFAEVLI